MPKLKMNEDEKQNRLIVAKIRYGMEMNSLTVPNLALALRLTPPTVYNRIKHPEQFTVEELRILSKKLHIPLIEFLQLDNEQ